MIFILIVALSARIIPEQECVNSPLGTLALLLIVFAIVKYTVFFVALLVFCSNLGRYLHILHPHYYQPVSPKQISQDRLKSLIKVPTQTLTCSICLDETSSESVCVVLDCSHVFHYECIKTWASEKPICPTCRNQI